MKILLGCFLLGCSIAAHAVEENLTLSVSPNNGRFEVKLPSNPATGFQWKVVQFDKNLLILSSSQYQKAQTKLIGAGGQMIFTFAIKKGQNLPEKTNMIFKYARSWEPNSATVKKVTVNFANSTQN